MDRSRLPYFAPSDLNQYPDQGSYKLNTMCDTLSQLWRVVYPIGSYYETSDNDFDPAESWGGDWEEVSPGRWHRTA